MKIIFIDYKNSCFKIILFLTGSYEKWQIEFRPTFRSIVLSSELTWFDEHPRRYTPAGEINPWTAHGISTTNLKCS